MKRALKIIALGIIIGFALVFVQKIFTLPEEYFVTGICIFAAMIVILSVLFNAVYNIAYYIKVEKAQQFLHFVLNRYEQTGSTELSRERLPALIELSGLGTVRDASTAFGGKPAYLLAAFKQLQQQLYHVN